MSAGNGRFVAVGWTSLDLATLVHTVSEVLATVPDAVLDDDLVRTELRDQAQLIHQRLAAVWVAPTDR